MESAGRRGHRGRADRAGAPGRGGARPGRTAGPAAARSSCCAVPGNNGGDGFVVARRLAAVGRSVVAILVADASKVGGRAAGHNWTVLQAMASAGSLELFVAPTPELLLRLRERIAEATLLVDALLGSGASGPLREPISTAVDLVNATRTHARAAGRPVRGARGRHADARRPHRRRPLHAGRGGGRDGDVPSRQGRLRPRPRGAAAWRAATSWRRSASRWRPRRGSCRPTGSGRRRGSPRSTGRSRSSAPTPRIGPAAASRPDPAARTDGPSVESRMRLDTHTRLTQYASTQRRRFVLNSRQVTPKRLCDTGRPSRRLPPCVNVANLEKSSAIGARGTSVRRQPTPPG